MLIECKGDKTVVDGDGLRPEGVVEATPALYRASRRIFVVAGALLFLNPNRARSKTTASINDQLRGIELETGGRLGVAIFDTRDGSICGWRLHERFPMCSTFKVLAAGLILCRAQDGKESLDRRVAFSVTDLVPGSPITSQHLAAGEMSVGELCEAAITASDNTAGNLLLASFGGPLALTSFARSIGDPISRLDRNETSLNQALPGDARDTTSAAAMARNLNSLLLGTVLDRTSRAQLLDWMLLNQTGAHRLRAGFPAGWRIGDKTGTGENGTANDIAIVMPPNRKSLIVTVYLTASSVGPQLQSDAIASVARIVTAAM